MEASPRPPDYAELCRATGARFCQGVETRLRQARGLVELNGSQTQLFNNRIDDEQLGVISAILGRMDDKNIKKIDLSCNVITDKGLKHLAEMTVIKNNIEYISLEANSLSSDCSEYISMIVHNSKNLKTLLLGRNPIGDEGMKKILLSLVDSSITSLDISNTDIGNKSFIALKQLLEKGNITKLRISNNRVPTSDNMFAITKLCEGLINCYNLTTIDLSSIRLGDDGLELVLKTLVECYNRKVLREMLSNDNSQKNDLSTDITGFKKTPEMFYDDFLNELNNNSDEERILPEPSLKCIVLKSNGLSSKSGQLLAQFILSAAGANLKTIVLDGNRIASKGASCLAYSVTKVHRGISLSLRYNFIKAQGLVALALASRASEHPLEKIYIEGNARYMGEGLPGTNEWIDKDEDGFWNAADEWERTFLELERRITRDQRMD